MLTSFVNIFQTFSLEKWSSTDIHGNVLNPYYEWLMTKTNTTLHSANVLDYSPSSDPGEWRQLKFILPNKKSTEVITKKKLSELETMVPIAHVVSCQAGLFLKLVGNVRQWRWERGEGRSAVFATNGKRVAGIPRILLLKIIFKFGYYRQLSDNIWQITG